MIAYFERDRFRSQSDRLIETIPSKGHMPQTHELSPEDTAIRPQNPTVRQNMYVNGPSLLELIIRTANGYVDLRKNEATVRVLGGLSEQLPAGREFTVVITNPGDWGGKENIEIFEAGTAPNFMHDPNTEVRVRQIEGQNPNVGSVDHVSVETSSGERQSIPVQSPPTGRTRPSHRSPAIEREPGGPRDLKFGEPRGVPADGRFDRGYPGHRDGSRYA